MGPRLKCRGANMPRDLFAKQPLASMGPRLKCRGAPQIWGSHCITAVASMGPRLKCRGADVTSPVVVVAVRLLQWGRG